ncbi:MAG: hypothetical protein ACYC46_11175 [Acidobacteriaceae bacterium]
MSILQRKTLAGLVVGFVLLGSAMGQMRDRHGRKYKPPPPTANIQVQVLKNFNDKPILNAAVVFHVIDENGKDQGNYEIKTNEEGKATIDVIPIGSKVLVQVIATGFATYGQNYDIPESKKTILIKMLHPEEQYSTFRKDNGKAAVVKPGIIEPIRPKNMPKSNSGGAPAIPQ